MSKKKLILSTLTVALALALPAVTWLLTVQLMAPPRPGGGIDLIAGRDLFRARCFRCHYGWPGAGHPSHQGPNLYQIGKVGATRKPGMTAAEYILESILDPHAFKAPNNRPGMPRGAVDGLTEKELRDLVAYLAGRGAVPDFEEILNLNIPDLSDEVPEKMSVRREEMLLAVDVLRNKGDCLQCHAVHNFPEYQVFAPALFGVGTTDPTLLKESIVDPHKVVSPSYRSDAVGLKSGDSASGKLIARTPEELVLFTRDEQSRLVQQQIPLDDVAQENGLAQIEKSQQSPMPADLGQLLTAEEIEAVITLIRQLNRIAGRPPNP